MLVAPAAMAQDMGQPAPDAEASFALGVAYDLGQGVPRDAGLACRYYGEAGERGQVAGAFNAGVMQDSGQCGGPRRADLAATWYARAAAAGSGRAQFNLALLYASGDGVPRNPAVASAWFRAAAANGIAAAAGRGGTVIRTGGGQALLLPVVPAYPGPGQDLDRFKEATLVWTAPEQPGAVRFFVEAYGLKPAGPVELAGQFVDLTSLRIALPADTVRVTWRVLTVGADPPRYAIGPWQDFTMAQAAPEPP